MDNKNLQKVYESAKKHYSMPDYDTFTKDMQDDGKRRSFYSSMQKEYSMPDYDTFVKDMGFSVNPPITGEETKINQNPQDTISVDQVSLPEKNTQMPRQQLIPQADLVQQAKENIPTPTADNNYMIVGKPRQTEYQKEQPSWWETTYKGLGAGIGRLGNSFLDAINLLSSGYTYNTPEGNAAVTPQLKERLNDKVTITDEKGNKKEVYRDPMIQLAKSTEAWGNKMSSESKPYLGEKDFIDLFKSGEIGKALQLGYGVALESAPQMLLGSNPYGRIFLGTTTAADQYEMLTEEMPDIPEWKKVSSSIGAGLFEQFFESKGVNPVKWFKTKGYRQGMDEIQKWATDLLSSRMKRIGMAAKNFGKDVATEGLEEVATSLSNDALNSLLDLDGTQGQGWQSQFNDAKIYNPNYTLSEFAADKAKSYLNDFIGGAMAGAYMGATARGLGEGYSRIAGQEQRQQNEYVKRAINEKAQSTGQDAYEIAKGVYLGTPESKAVIDRANEMNIEDAITAEVDGISIDGNIVTISDFYNNKGVVVKGHVEFVEGPNGPAIMDTSKSDEMLYIRNEEGKIIPVASKDAIVSDRIDAEEYKQYHIAREKARYYSQETFNAGDNVYLTSNGQIVKDETGNPLTSQVTSVGEDGSVNVEVEDVQGNVQEMTMQPEEALESLSPVAYSDGENIYIPKGNRIINNETGEIVQEFETKEEADAFIQGKTDVGEWNAFDIMSENQAENEGAPASEQNVLQENQTEEQQNVIQEEKPAPSYPLTEEGEPDFSQMTADQSIQVLDELGDQETIDAFIANNLSDAQKSYTKAEKMKPKSTSFQAIKEEQQKIIAEREAAKAKLDLWSSIKSANDLRKLQRTSETLSDANLAEQRQARIEQEQAEKTAEFTGKPTFKESPKVVGNSYTRTLPDGTKIKGKYQIVSAESLIPSHDPNNNWETTEGFPTVDGVNINDRDYKNDAQARQVTEQMAANYGGQAIENVPVVSSDGVVYDGNGRTIAGQIAAQNGTDAEYIQQLNENASNYGFTPEQIASVQNPRLVLVLDEDLPYNTETFAKFNAQEKKTQSTTEKSVSAGKRMTESVVNQISDVLDSYSNIESLFGSEKATADLLKVLQDNGIIQPTEIAGLTENGLFSAAGREYITSLVLGSIFSEDAVRRMGNNLSLKNGILRAVPAILENRKLGEYSLIDEINEAINLLYEARANNMALPLYLRQTNAFEETPMDKFSEFSQILAAQLDAGVARFRELLDLYNNSAKDNVGGQQAIFGEVTKEDVKQSIIDLYGKQTEAVDATPSIQGSQQTEQQEAAEVKQQVEQAESEVNTNPTEAQKEAGNYKKGHVKIDGYDITIEQPKGSTRSGVDENGNKWETKMNNTYGYIRGTQSVDGDHIDVFLSDNPTEGNVYVVDQINQETGEFDEHKVMYGFNSIEEAREAYLSNYSEGWKIGTITEVSKDEFKKWIDSSKRKTKPFSEYSSVNKTAGQNEVSVKPRKKLDLYKFVLKGDETRPVLSGVHYKDGMANATDGHILVRVKTEYPKEMEGKTIKKNGEEVRGNYANVESVLPKEMGNTFPVNIDELKEQRNKILDTIKKEWNDNGKKIQLYKYLDLSHVNVNIGGLKIDMKYNDFDRMVEALEMTGINSLSLDWREYGSRLVGKSGDALILAVLQGEENENAYGEVKLTDEAVVQKKISPVSESTMTDSQKLAFDAISEMLDKAGIPVETLTDEQMNQLANGATLMTVYHGSGAEFEAFDHSFMGTGEGAQAYGWGSYVTEVEGIGREYAISSSNNPSVSTLRDSDEVYEDVRSEFESRYGYDPYQNGNYVANEYYEITDNDKAVEEAKKFFDVYNQSILSNFDFDNFDDYERESFLYEYSSEIMRELDKIYSDKEKSSRPNLYTVEIPDNTGSNYLDWENVLGQSKRDYIVSRLSNIADSDFDFDYFTEKLNQYEEEYNLTGEGLYKIISKYGYDGNDRKASLALNEIGIVGISYPAQYTTGGRSDNARNYVIFNEKDLEIKDRISFLNDGVTVYGATVGGKIYMNKSALNPETPIHEYTHIWDNACKKNNPELWNRGVELMKQTPVWEEVKNDPNYSDLKTDDEIASEVHSRLTGKDGTRILEDMAEQVKREGTTSEISKTNSLISKLKKWLSDFWYWVKDTMTTWTKEEASRVSLEDFINMPLKDLAQGRRLSDNTEDVNVQFQIKKPIEESKNLIALHNLSEESLQKAFELGGFPMPSIAVTSKDIGHTDFGDISLVFNKETINPTDRRNRLYAGDAWTPTFPEVRLKINEGVAGEIRNKINDLLKDKEYTKGFNLYLDEANMTDVINRSGSFRDAYKGNDAMKIAFLSDKGISFKPVLVDKQYSTKVDNKTLKEIVSAIGKPANELIILGYEDKMALEPIIRKVVDSYRKNKNEEALKNVEESKRDRLRELLNKNLGKELSFSDVDSLLYSAFKYEKEGDVKVPEGLKTREIINRKFTKKLQQEYESWLDEISEGIIEKRGIRNERDMFTPSGNRRSWEALHDEITLDNVVKNMRSQDEIGGKGFFGSSIFGAAQKEISSIEDLRELARKRLAEMTDEEYEAERDKIVSRLSDIDIPGRSDYFGSSIDMQQNIIEAVKQSHTPNGIYKELKKIYPKVTKDIAEEIADIVKDIQSMSKKYFEAKPYRAVGFDEVKLAVVPKGTSKEVIDRLQGIGIPVKTYKKGDEDARKRIVNSAAKKEELLFRFIGEKGASNLDAAQEVTTRMDNLKVAREMEQSGKDAKTIKLATGWERGADGKFRYETMDFEYYPKGDARKNTFIENSTWYGEYMTLVNKILDEETLTEEENKRYEELYKQEQKAREQYENTERIYLDDYVKDDELFKAYPELKQTKIVFVDKINGEDGSYSMKDNTITVNINSDIDAKSVLSHEIQHAIQRIEGFATGGNYKSVLMFFEENPEVEMKLVVDETYKEAERRGIDITKDELYIMFTENDDVAQSIENDVIERNNITESELGEIYNSGVDAGYRSIAGEVEARNVQTRLGMSMEERMNSLASETEDVAREDQIILNDMAEKAMSVDSSLIRTRRTAESLAQELGLDVEIIEDVELLEGKKRYAKGWYDVKTKKIYVVLPNATGSRDVARTILHEGVAHYNLREMLGDDFDLFLDNIYSAANKTIKDRIDSMSKEQGLSRRVATEEYLAMVAEDVTPNDVNTSWFSKVKARFIQLLSKLGINLQGYLTDNDFKYIVWKSYDNLKRKSQMTISEIAKNKQTEQRLLEQTSSEQFAEEISASYNEVVEEEVNNIRYRTVTDPKEIEFLENQPKTKAYRAMQVIDGKLYSPMSAAVDGKLTNPIELNKWEKSVERPDLAIPEINEKTGKQKVDKDGDLVFKFILEKGVRDATNKKASTVPARYNPYIHASRTPLNDQFKSAWIRPNLVTVEVEIPNSELTSGYKAEKAKNAVGEVDWKKGVVSTILAKKGNPRRVILSRYDKPIRVVKNDEVARMIYEMVGNEIAIPENVVTPQLRVELEKLGVKIGEPENGVRKTPKIEEAIKRGLLVDNSLLEDASDIESIIEEESNWEPDIRFRMADEAPKTKMDIATESLLKAGARKEAATSVRLHAMKAIGKSLRDINKAIREQAKYSDENVSTLREIVDDLMRIGELSNLDSQDIRYIFSKANQAVTKSDLTEIANGIVDRLMDATNKRIISIMNKKLAEAKTKKNEKVAKASKMSGYQQITLSKLDELMNGLPTKDDAKKQYGKVQERYEDSIDEDYRMELDAELEAYEMYFSYLETISPIMDNIKSLNEERDELLQAKKGKRGNEAKSYRETINEIDKAIVENKADLADALTTFVNEIDRIGKEGRENKNDFSKKKKERKELIRKLANFDLSDIPAYTQEQVNSELKKKRYWQNSLFANFLFSPLNSLNMYLKLFGRKHAGGKGYLFNYFEPRQRQAMTNKYVGMKQATEELDKASIQFTGMDFNKLSERLHKKSDILITYMDGGKNIERYLTHGQALYLYMINKMSDGAMKLRKMGISEEDIENIASKLDSNVLDFADWIQNDFLPKKRAKYNKVHMDMFGVPMSRIENYFPIRIAKGEVEEKQDKDKKKEDLSSTITGSIIKRTPNTKQIDLTSDALSVLYQNIDEMEDWAAYAQLREDFNTLIEYNTFKKRLKNMKSVHGASDKLYDNFVSAIKTAVNKDTSVNAKENKFFKNVSRGTTVASLNFNLNPAIKQILGYPAIFGEADLKDIIKNTINPYEAFKWAMENLPLFEERVSGGNAGWTQLELDKESSWEVWNKKYVEWATKIGMAPNRFMDAIVCAATAKAAYDTSLRRYKKWGFKNPEEKALADAERAYNETQPSSQGLYISPMQRSNNVADIIFSLFRNANFAFYRRLVEAVRNLSRVSSKDRYNKILSSTAHRLELEEGMAKEQSEKVAREMTNKQIAKDSISLVLFGYVMNTLWSLGNNWAYLLAGDDDDEKKKMIKDALIVGTLSPITGIPLFGSFAEDWMWSILRGSYYDLTLLSTPLTDEIERTVSNSYKLAKSISKEDDRRTLFIAAEFAKSLVNLCVKTGIGINPDLLTNMVYGVINAAQSDFDSVSDFRDLILTIINAPAESREKLIIDELGITEEGLNESLSQGEIIEIYDKFVDRRIERQKGILAPLAKEDYQTIKTAGKQFKKQVRERVELKQEDNGKD